MFRCNLQGLGSAISGNLGTCIFGKNFYATRQPMVALRLDSVIYYPISAPGNPSPALYPLCNPHNSVSVKIGFGDSLFIYWFFSFFSALASAWKNGLLTTAAAEPGGGGGGAWGGSAPPMKTVGG